MPVVKGLSERPKAKNFSNPVEYMAAMENYVDALENWVDIRAFQDGDDEQPEIKGTAKFSMTIDSARKDVIQSLLTQFCLLDEATVKEFIAHKYQKGKGLFE